MQDYNRPAPSQRPKNGGFLGLISVLPGVGGICFRSFTIMSLAFGASGAPASAQLRENAPVLTPRETVTQIVAAPVATRPLTKFEARHIRQRCLDRANATGAQGANKASALKHCYQMHISARRLWGDCKRALRGGNAEGRAKDEAIKACVVEKLRQDEKERRAK
jgi:hypothetical protein